MEVSLLPLLVALFILALLGILLSKKIRMPGIVGVLLVGVILKTIATITGEEILPMVEVNELAKIGVTLLLFLLGIEFN